MVHTLMESFVWNRLSWGRQGHWRSSDFNFTFTSWCPRKTLFQHTVGEGGRLWPPYFRTSYDPASCALKFKVSSFCPMAEIIRGLSRISKEWWEMNYYWPLIGIWTTWTILVKNQYFQPVYSCGSKTRLKKKCEINKSGKLNHSAW